MFLFIGNILEFVLGYSKATATASHAPEPMCLAHYDTGGTQRRDPVSLVWFTPMHYALHHIWFGESHWTQYGQSQLLVLLLLNWKWRIQYNHTACILHFKSSNAAAAINIPVVPVHGGL